MKNQKKLIVIATVTALLICAVMSCALADEKIYTSPVFKLPADKISEWVESQPAETVPEEGTPAEGTSEEETSEEGTPEEGTPDAGEPAEGTTEAEPEPEPEAPVIIPEEDAREEDIIDETSGGTEPEEGTEPQGEGEAEVDSAKDKERSVTIYTSQGDVVTEGELIYLTSSLKGFDGLDIGYQWQVDRGDGMGWVDIEGANRSTYTFVASRETIAYSWRLIVNIYDE